MKNKWNWRNNYLEWFGWQFPRFSDSIVRSKKFLKFPSAELFRLITTYPGVPVYQSPIFGDASTRVPPPVSESYDESHGDRRGVPIGSKTICAVTMLMDTAGSIHLLIVVLHIKFKNLKNQSNRSKMLNYFMIGNLWKSEDRKEKWRWTAHNGTHNEKLQQSVCHYQQIRPLVYVLSCQLEDLAFKSKNWKYALHKHIYHRLYWSGQ